MHLTDQRCDEEDEKGLPFIPDIPPTRRGDKVEQG